MNNRSSINTATTRRKTIISLFLSVILVTGTIALSFSSSSFITVDAQSDLNLQITQLTTDELNFPTGIDFLAEDDILVIEKNTGQVKRILEGKVLNEPVLDVNVASESERGLLGIAILNTKEGLTNSDITTINEKFQEANNLNNEGEVKVFLFYTETKDIDNGNILGNRLYKYDFIDGKLVNPKLLLDLPFLPGPAHNGGVLELGPDNNLYLVVGDLYLLKEHINHPDYPAYVTLTQNVEASKLPDGRGGVLRLTVDGDPVLDEKGHGIVGDTFPLNLYYGYGIRNSFGIAFDPVTGILWETENGIFYGDEINVILPGFNGGWRKVWGLSTEFENFNNEEFDRSKLISLNGKGTYYDPVFTWADTVAPTAITFIDSKIFGEEYENDLLVGSANQGGRIFHFNLNETRTGLDLTTSSSGELVDRMADVDKELTPVTAGRNLGMITDIEINPYDGKIYVVSGLNVSGDNESWKNVSKGQSKKGKIYQAYPKPHQQKQQHQQNSITELLPQQRTPQQQIPSSIVQEQMHQQQIVKLKQLLDAGR